MLGDTMILNFPTYVELKNLCIYKHCLAGYSLVVWDALNDVFQFQMDLSGLWIQDFLVIDQQTINRANVSGYSRFSRGCFLQNKDGGANIVAINYDFKFQPNRTFTTKDSIICQLRERTIEYVMYFSSADYNCTDFSYALYVADFMDGERKIPATAIIIIFILFECIARLCAV
ncbi:hypothetical protein RvY_10378-1 [Ramazzottius varieornatus]|uniref:Uncharacterized protein n=1 Tax=Ramazzottius varieornatus TaxID=947166 RepID=A0A1D1VH19_RAMVA|nr:hypothetical protein RvY_10378-1 [Ramazzottius varieornatus]